VRCVDDLRRTAALVRRPMRSRACWALLGQGIGRFGDVALAYADPNKAWQPVGRWESEPTKLSARQTV
jgi:hypothetical protein